VVRPSHFFIWGVPAIKEGKNHLMNFERKKKKRPHLCYPGQWDSGEQQGTSKTPVKASKKAQKGDSPESSADQRRIREACKLGI